VRLKWLMAGFTLALLFFIALQIWLPVEPAGVVEVYIPPGIPSYAIGQRLKQAGVIRSAALFRLLARISGDASHLKSGYYRFNGTASLPRVLERIQRGDTIFYHVTVPEGLRTDEILVLLAGKTGTSPDAWKGALEKLAGNGSAEGLLLPETYTYHKPVNPKEILASMMDGQKHVIKPLLPAWLDGKGLRIVASIVEKETAIDEERPLIAAVIRNRLAKSMALQMDPTVIYGLYRMDGAFSGNLHKADMKRDTPWNTYTRKGLPPTPICNPGKASLWAAAHPAHVDYLYFVADGSGGHVFASSLKAHEKNVRQWMRIEQRKERK